MDEVEDCPHTVIRRERLDLGDFTGPRNEFDPQQFGWIKYTCDNCGVRFNHVGKIIGETA